MKPTASVWAISLWIIEISYAEPTLESNGWDLTEQLKEAAIARLPVNVFHARQFQTVDDRE